jgi:bacterioferritin-associated ferredoxin
MIVCSCNGFSDHQLRSALARASQRPRMSQIYDNLGSTPQCGQCAHTIKRIMDEITLDPLSPSSLSTQMRSSPSNTRR